MLKRKRVSQTPQLTAIFHLFPIYQEWISYPHYRLPYQEYSESFAQTIWRREPVNRGHIREDTHKHFERMNNDKIGRKSHIMYCCGHTRSQTTFHRADLNDFLCPLLFMFFHASILRLLQDADSSEQKGRLLPPVCEVWLLSEDHSVRKIWAHSNSVLGPESHHHSAEGLAHFSACERRYVTFLVMGRK